MLDFFRIVVIALPQLLILLLFGSSNDWLFGWNQTDDAMGTLVILFLLNPLLALTLLVVEIRRCCRASRGRSACFQIVLAVGLLLETLASDFFILTQLRM